MSSFRFGVLVGALVGYVLGTRAGRQRYEQIASAARSAARSGPAQQLSTEVREIADRAGGIISEKATEGVSRVTSTLRGSGHNGESDLPAGTGNGGASGGAP